MSRFFYEPLFLPTADLRLRPCPLSCALRSPLTLKLDSRLASARCVPAVALNRKHHGPQTFGPQIRSPLMCRTENPFVTPTASLVFAASPGVFLPNPQRIVWPPRRSASINLVGVFVTRNIVVSRFCKKSTCELRKRRSAKNTVTLRETKLRALCDHARRKRILRGIFDVESRRCPRK